MLLEISLSFEKTSIIDSLQGTPIILLNKPFSAQEFSITLSQQRFDCDLVLVLYLCTK